MIKTIVIDDEPSVAEIIEYFIETQDLPLELVGTADNGITGQALINSKKPELVFIDIQMPFMNGFEVMKAFPNTKFIVVTAFDTFHHAQEALRLGACDIILKPFDGEQLKQSIARAVGWHLTQNNIVNDIVEYINQRYAKKITLTELSEEFLLTQSYIARLFKKHMGESVIVYVNRVRITNAKRLLDHGINIKDAAESVGYNNMNHFYKEFKRFTGMTPAAYCAKA